MINNFFKKYLIANKLNLLNKELKKNTQSSLKLIKEIKIINFLKVMNKISN